MVTVLNPKMKRIAVISSGTDTCGINGAIRAIVRTAKSQGIQTFGVKWGFHGLVENRLIPISTRDVSGKIGKAGCFLGTSRPIEKLDDQKIQSMVRSLNAKSINGVIVIGGGGSIAQSDCLLKNGFPVIAIPSTVQDDIVGSDISLGVDSALNNILQCIEHIRSCDSSRNRCFLVQVDGRETGSLAARAALTSGAEICLVPEDTEPDLEKITKYISKTLSSGKTQCISIVAHGWKPGIDELSTYIHNSKIGSELLVRKTVLGYIQRGGQPSGYDRILGTLFGAASVKALAAGETGVTIGIKDGSIVKIPYKDIIGHYKPIDPTYTDLFEATNK